MFERFTDRARRVVVQAQKEAQALGTDTIRSEHILLGIASETTGRSAVVLAAHGSGYDSLRAACTAGDAGARDHLAFSAGAKRAMEASLREALQEGSNVIEPEHILRALCGFDCGAARLLAAAGVDPAQLRRDLTLVTPAQSDADEAPTEAATPRRERAAKRKALEAFGRNLTEAAAAGELDPVIGRDREIERVIQILCRRTKANPVLVGPAGVGKTALAEALAQRIAEGAVPDMLAGVQLWAVDLGQMVAGTRYRGDFEERVKNLVKEASSPDVIVFIDEIHSVLGAGTSETGGMGAADILKPALARGDLRLLGATTVDEYRRLEKDKALERRMAPVEVDEPTTATAVEILRRLRPTYEEFHRIVVDDAALEAAVRYTVRYVPDRNLPDKAIDALDEAMARARLSGPRGTEEVRDAREVMCDAAERRRRNDALDADDKAAEAAARELLDGVDAAWCVSEEDIAAVVSANAGVPIVLDDGEAQRLLNLEPLLHERVVGQDAAVAAVTRALRRSRAGLSSGRRVTGSFLFVGPTGVGKTELARAVADVFMGRPDALVQVDMSEYMESHSVARLIGSPPGYVGHGEGGQLTEAVRRNPWSVVLLDEIEKAHPDVLNVLLQLLEEGRLTDSQGRKVDFSNTVVIMTSNIGTELLSSTAVGFGRPSARSDETVILDAVRKTLRPELVGRIDEIVAFHALSTGQLAEIARSMVSAVATRLAATGVALELTDSAYEVVVAAGYDPLLGARPMRRAVQRLVEDRLANALLDRTARAGQLVVMDADAGELVITVVDGVEPAPSVDVAAEV
jgi:ATP-dependent Clp protease ATP-binding subunit ClpC